MKFFVPGFEDRLMAEHLWAETRRWLSGMGLATSTRRIAALAFEGKERDHFIAVGGEAPNFEMSAGNEVVLAILESSDLGLFYVCTPSRGILEGMPYPMSLNHRWRVVNFDEEVVGCA